ncbi:MAG: hypothetical protein HY051_04140 [Candidatus Aenigmarchaeota archaeon]|nr:hypothetical protein [Candidatus Aenigmarchaeota archaeon]
MSNVLNKILNVLVFLLPTILSISQILNIGTSQSLIILGVIILLVVIYFSIDYVKGLSFKVNKTSERIKDMEERINYMEKIHDLDKRVAMLEKRRKKGEIDPKTVILFLLLILLILYLRSIGQL